MYNQRLNEANYPAMVSPHRLNKFYIGQRVIYSGRTNYSWGDSEIHNMASKQLATVI